MPKPMMTKAQLACVAESFRDELVRLHQRMDFGDYKDTKITLSRRAQQQEKQMGGSLHRRL